MVTLKINSSNKKRERANKLYNLFALFCIKKTPGCTGGSKKLKRCIENKTPFD